MMSNRFNNAPHNIYLAIVIYDFVWYKNKQNTSEIWCNMCSDFHVLKVVGLDVSRQDIHHKIELLSAFVIYQREMRQCRMWERRNRKGMRWKAGWMMGRKGKMMIVTGCCLFVGIDVY